MDVNGDGAIDVLSGSYSRHEQPMAGTFQVLLGTKKKTFARAEELKGTDGEPLVIETGGDDIDRICTRPFAADLNGDGKLDIVSGNFRGTFVFFAGAGKGKFAPKCKVLGGEKPLAVDHHSDPFLVDWDGDGDLDLLSGSSGGGVFLFANTGTKTAPAFGERQTLLAPPGNERPEPGQMWLGDAHLKGAGRSTRVWADDVDGDGKVDLLVGDNNTLVHPAKGVDEKTIAKELPAWEAKFEALMQQPREGTAAQEKWRREYDAMQKEREKIVRDERTGFVWLYVQRAAVTPGG